ncbi:MAG: cytochrome o ubiquinol oxidase subunit IV, partial [Pseudomonadota bacterium]
MEKGHVPTVGNYLNGFALAVALTAIPFAVVWLGLLPASATIIVIAVTAIIQVVVHLVFFLHLSTKTTPSENLFFFAFAAVLIVLMVGGSLWIMVDL